MKRKIALGPGAASLILIVVMLSLCMLAMLMQISARNDVSLSDRSTATIARVYDVYSDAEHRLARLDAFLSRCRDGAQDMDQYLEAVEQNLPEGFTLRDDTVTWQHKLDKRVLTCTVKLLGPGEAKRTEWLVHTFDEPARESEGEEMPDD